MVQAFLHKIHQVKSISTISFIAKLQNSLEPNFAQFLTHNSLFKSETNRRKICACGTYPLHCSPAVTVMYLRFRYYSESSTTDVEIGEYSLGKELPFISVMASPTIGGQATVQEV